MKKIKNISIIIVFIVLISLYTSSLIRESKFSIDYMICGLGFGDCFVAAKFDDMLSCQIAVEKGNWLCDQTDPQNIKCRVGTDSIATSYCRD